MEEWRPVVGYEENYSISNLGRVRRDKQSCGTQKGLIIKQANDRGGYPIVILHNILKKTWCVHKLVAYAFLGARPKGLDINHKDGNKENNKLSNLEYVTKSENQKHAYINGLVKAKRGEESQLSKLNKHQIKIIRFFWDKKLLSQYKIADLFNIDQSNVSYIVKGKTWKTA